MNPRPTTSTPSAPKRGPKIVVIGGGTGSFSVLSGLKNYAHDITAIVNMSDDGGSTGILRDELGVLPPGDIRQCLVALSQSDQIMRDLFNYRFAEGTFEGHSFGNLFLTALEKVTGSFDAAVGTASQVLNISGRVVPVTLTNSQLVLARADGTRLTGQHAIEGAQLTPRPKLSLTPSPTLNPEAAATIAAADLIVIAPGNLYASLAPTLIVPGLGAAVAGSPAKVIYIANLVTKPGQTDGFGVPDFAAEIERFIGYPALDYVIYNTHKPTKNLLEKYAQAGEHAIEVSPAALKSAHYQSVGDDIISDTVPRLAAADTKLIPRTLIRHDPDRTARLIMRVYFG